MDDPSLSLVTNSVSAPATADPWPTSPACHTAARRNDRAGWPTPRLNERDGRSGSMVASTLILKRYTPRFCHYFPKVKGMKFKKHLS